MKRKRAAAFLLAPLMLLCALPITANAADEEPEIISGYTAREYVELSVRCGDSGETVTALYDAVYDRIYLNLKPAAELAGIQPEESIDPETGNYTAKCEGFSMSAEKAAEYAKLNGRYLYLPDGFIIVDGMAYFPIEVVCKACGLDLDQNSVTGRVTLSLGEDGILKGGKQYYNETFGKENVNWLSRIIQAEAEGECLAAKIAVGNVIMNRLDDPYFPNTIHDVIFDVDVDGTVQFVPTQTGGIKVPPSEEALAAACLCFEGVNTGGAAEFFVEAKYAKGSWFEKSLSYVVTLGKLAFYADPKRIS